MSSASIPPEGETVSSALDVAEDDEVLLVPDLQQKKEAVTSICLGLFSVSPALFIFQAWTFIPALLLCVWGFWETWKLKRQGVAAVTLQIVTWVMVVLSADIFFIYPDLNYQVRAVMFEGTLLFPVITSIAIAGIFVLPVFAVLAVGYGFKAKRDILGITAGIIHLVCWVIFGLILLGYLLMDEVRN